MRRRSPWCRDDLAAREAGVAVRSADDESRSVADFRVLFISEGARRVDDLLDESARIRCS
jgi:hypothetical protein